MSLGNVVGVSVALFVLSFAPGARAHPGQNLDVKIEIRDGGVTQHIIISADMIGVLFAAHQAQYQAPQRVGDEHRYTDPDAEAAFRKTVADIFELENPITINGKLVQPELRQLEFVEANSLGYLTGLPPDVSIRLFYPAPAELREVGLVWTIYPEDATRRALGMPAKVGVIAQLDAPEENRLLLFTPEEPEQIWHASTQTKKDSVAPVVAAFNQPTLGIPALSIAVVGVWLIVLVAIAVHRRPKRVPRGLLLASVLPLALAGLTRNVLVFTVQSPWGPTIELPDDAQAVGIFETLQKNVYRAFEKKTSGDVYDVLAYSVDGELLDEVYNEVHQSLILRDQGGAVARIRAVDILDAEVEHAGVLADTQAAAFTVRSRWRVHGAVYHWGHVHARTNEYTAKFTVAQRAGSWKITGISDLEGERIVQEGDDPRISRRSARPTSLSPRRGNTQRRAARPADTPSETDSAREP